MKPATFTIGPGLDCSIDRLMVTRLLVQANSGAGKSWCVRRLLEQTHGRVQQLVIDPEGEFATLREKYDYVLAARTGGDTVADPRSAKLLAERLLELGVSAILDLYELKAHERIAFVKNFLDALVNAPKTLWHPVVIVVDEAHVYCPEKGHGEAESSDSVTDLCTRGRKRGFCAVLATQRISKLNKNAAAELNNKLIGRSSLDVDMKRAADELGFQTRDERLSLRDLAAGEFFAFGPALCHQIQKVKVGPVATTHPESGSSLAAVVPPPTDKVRAILSKLADLPAEAEAREKTAADLRKEIATLKRELSQKPKVEPAAPLPPKEIPLLTAEEHKRLEHLITNMAKFTENMDNALGAMSARVEGVHGEIQYFKNALTGRMRPWDQKGFPSAMQQLTRPANTPSIRRAAHVITNGHSARPEGLPSGERKILIACAQFENVPKEDLTILTGFKRSTRDAYIQRLRERGYVDDTNGTVQPTADGLVALGHWDPLPTGDDLREHWLARLPEGERRILQVLVEAYPNFIDRDTLEESTGFKRSTRDAYLQRMKPKRIIELGHGTVRASQMLFS
jgi:uncharacterized protein